MAQLSISDAARAVGISRPYLYKRYINTGKISVCRDHGNPTIDTSELIRVFGELQPQKPKEQQKTTADSKQPSTSIQDMTAEIARDNRTLQEKLNAAQQQLEASAARERWLQEQVETLQEQHAQTLRALADLRSGSAEPQRRPGFFAQLFGKG